MRRVLFGLLLPLLVLGQDRDFSKFNARPSPPWARNAVIYEINVRAFSPAGDFQGITSRLDELSKLGVDLLWVMPIHPNGQLKKVKRYAAISDAPGGRGWGRSSIWILQMTTAAHQD